MITTMLFSLKFPQRKCLSYNISASFILSFIVILLLNTSTVYSQEKNNFTNMCISMTDVKRKPLLERKKKVWNIPKYDKQLLHFGFTLGINTADFLINLRENMDTLFSVDAISQSGFDLGIVSSLRLAEHFDLRFVPALAFSERKLLFKFDKKGTPENTIQKSIESTFLEFPFYLKYKSARINNYRVYLLGGIKYSIDMASQENVNNDPDKQFVRLKRNDFGYGIGFGIDFYLEMFKFSTEAKMTYGINNMLIKDRYIYSSVIDQLFSKIFLLSFNFE